MQYPEIGKTWLKLSLITGHAQRDHAFKFTSLAHLLDVEYLRDCYHSLNRNKAVGIDNVSWQEYGVELDKNLEQLVSRLKRKKYKPLPAKRVYIPKSDGKRRALGLPALEDEIVQKAIARILEAVYEADFMDFSYGFSRIEPLFHYKKPSIQPIGKLFTGIYRCKQHGPL